MTSETHQSLMLKTIISATERLESAKINVVGSEPEGNQQYNTFIESIYSEKTYQLLNPSIRERINRDLFKSHVLSSIVTDASIALFSTLSQDDIYIVAKSVANAVCIDGPDTDASEIPKSIKKYSPSLLFENNTIQGILKIFRANPVDEITKYLINNKHYLFLIIIKISHNYNHS